jgi:DNA-binding response OmpR family regulator
MTDPTGLRILVAEDDDIMRDLVARWLTAAGYEVVRASNGEQVIEMVRELKPAAIIMDLTMPRMDGFQVLAQFRVLGLPLAPVLLLTGRHTAEDVRKALSLGAKDYLAKPVERAHLLSRLERVLKNTAPAAPAKKADTYLD